MERVGVDSLSARPVAVTVFLETDAAAMRRALLLIFLFGLASSSFSIAGWKDWFKSPEQKDREFAHGLANHYRQQTIEKFHILAHAQSVEVLDWLWVDALGTPAKESKNSALILLVHYVIRWEGPMKKGGMTQVISAFDCARENAPVVQSVVVSTNGVTNEKAAETAGSILGLLLKN